MGHGWFPPGPYFYQALGERLMMNSSYWRECHPTQHTLNVSKHFSLGIDVVTNQGTVTCLSGIIPLVQNEDISIKRKYLMRVTARKLSELAQMTSKLADSDWFALEDGRYSLTVTDAFSISLSTQRGRLSSKNVVMATGFPPMKLCSEGLGDQRECAKDLIVDALNHLAQELFAKSEQSLVVDGYPLGGKLRFWGAMLFFVLGMLAVVLGVIYVVVNEVMAYLSVGDYSSLAGVIASFVFCVAIVSVYLSRYRYF